jgi:hypothetical protein
MKKMMIKMVMFIAIISTFSSCTTLNKTMREPNTRVELNKSDFSLSEQVSAEAKSTKILGIDWSRIFSKKTGALEGGNSISISLASIPVIGSFVVDKIANYSLYELTNKNQGYDVIFFSQFETKYLNLF